MAHFCTSLLAIGGETERSQLSMTCSTAVVSMGIAI